MLKKRKIAKTADSRAVIPVKSEEKSVKKGPRRKAKRAEFSVENKKSFREGKTADSRVELPIQKQQILGLK